MAQLTKTQFETLYGATGTTFPDNSTQDISAADLRQFGDDIADSLSFPDSEEFWKTEGTTECTADTTIEVTGSLVLETTEAFTIDATQDINIITVDALNISGVTVDIDGPLTVQDNPAGGTIFGGTYAPTITGVTNVAASTAYLCQYMRVGPVVTVSGLVDIDPTLTVETIIRISLPVASNFSNIRNCAGTAITNTYTGGFTGNLVGAIIADTTNNEAHLTYFASDIANQTFSFTFTYLII